MTTPTPAAERRMSARQLDRGQVRAEDPALLVLHLDTDAAPAVDSPHDDAAAGRSDARADGLEAHTVAALELIGQCFGSHETQGTWCAAPALRTFRRAKGCVRDAPTGMLGRAPEAAEDGSEPH